MVGVRPRGSSGARTTLSLVTVGLPVLCVATLQPSDNVWCSGCPASRWLQAFKVFHR